MKIKREFYQLKPGGVYIMRVSPDTFPDHYLEYLQQTLKSKDIEIMIVTANPWDIDFLPSGQEKEENRGCLAAMAILMIAAVASLGWLYIAISNQFSR